MAIIPSDNWPLCATILCAGGSGKRMGGLSPKQFEPLGDDGLPPLVTALWALAELPMDSVVITHPAGQRERVEELLAPVPGSARRIFVTGGDTRQASVLNGLEALPRSTDAVFIHDAARPFASPELYRTLMARLLEQPELGGVVPCLAIVDTVKHHADKLLLGTMPRDGLALVQTPQLFPFGLILELHRHAAEHGIEVTDDAALLEERAGDAAKPRVGTVEGAQWNLKITRPADRVIASALLKGELVARWTRI
ncbi:MAG: 2-C-methyl-D-erythritol 4-phosphate cytidylyltransferase [Candidatus Cloacimonetes bacterium]|nr:2-C-methyl-D-erythritol 4-phosphate cytidylyltransferase [Candidatus Cloacimonadota bacterium]